LYFRKTNKIKLETLLLIFHPLVCKPTRFCPWSQS